MTHRAVDQLATAQQALALRAVDAAAAQTMATQLLARRTVHAEARAVAHRALALCSFDRGGRSEAGRHAAAAVRWARRGSDRSILAGCLTTEAGVSYFSGRRDRAVAAINEAALVEDSSDVRYTRAWMMYRAGRWADAVDAHERLLADATLDAPDRMLAMSQFALVLAELGRHDEAVALAREASAAAGVADESWRITLAYNAAYCLSLAERIPEALRLFDALAERVVAQPTEVAWIAEGHAGVLLRCNLLAEARQVCQVGLAAAGPRGPLELRAELHWRHARACGALGDLPAARQAAGRAAVLFRRMGTTGRAQLAELAELLARPDTALTLQRLTALGTSFEEQDRWEPAVEAASAVAIRAARRQFEIPVAVLTLLNRARSRVTALGRARVWLGLAAAASVTGNARQTMRACRHGLSALDGVRAQLGSGEMRARAAALSADLLDFGFNAAMHGGDAWEVLDLIERARARSIMMRPARSVEVAAATAALRNLQRDPESTAEALSEAEAAVRRASHRAAPEAATAIRPLSRREARHALGGRLLIEYAEDDGTLFAVTFEGSNAVLHRLAPIDEVRAAVRELRFAVQRLSRANLAPSMAAAMLAAAGSALDQLDRMLCRSLGSIAADIAPPGVAQRDQGLSGIVVIPPAELSDVPFHALASWAHTDVRVSPTATWWCRNVGAAPDRRRAVTVAGPGLQHAEREADLVAACYPDGARVQSASAAFVEQIARSDIAHVAAHGRLRADHPHLSSITLADGQCTLYDFEAVTESVAETIVLAACETGGGIVHAGDEVLGFVNGLLSLGSRNVVASSRLMPDRVALPFMTALHRSIAGGASVTSALRHARQTLNPAVPDELAMLVSVIGFGTGD